MRIWHIAKGITIIFSFIFGFVYNGFGQNNLNDIDIIYGHDFENNTLGDYLPVEWNRDWSNPAWNDRQSELDIVSDESDIVNPSKSMKIYFPANSLGPGQGGTSWVTDLSEKHEEAYFSYDIRFMPGFQFQAGGKLPGIKGGSVPATDKPTGYDGFCAYMMFKADRPMFYLYYADSPQSQYGVGFEWGKDYAANTFSPSQIKLEFAGGPVYFSTGLWHNLTYRVVLNSINTNNTGNYDGILEAYFDGKLVTQLSHVLYRHTSSLGIDKIAMMSFFGGATDDYRNPINEWLDIDNVLLYTFKSSISVPRGRELSPTNRTINFWRNFRVTNTEVPAAPGSLRTTDITNASVTLKWNDNSNNEYGFQIFRSLSETDGYSLICTATANVTSYYDKTVQAGTKYYYRIRAYNDVGYSGYSAVLTASTSSIQVPSTPSGLNATSITYSSALIFWIDNSGIETGFEVERTGPNNTNIIKIVTTGANVTSFTDNSLQMNSTYYYRVRAFTGGTYSAYSSSIMIMTPYVQLPSPPTLLKSSDFTEKSIKISWSDNSYNEKGFVISRSLATNQSVVTEIQVEANSTSFTDDSLESNTSYIYRVRAMNEAGKSASSNKNIATTMSLAETKRVKDGLVAYYNFAYNPDYLVQDLSGYLDPLNLKIVSPSSVAWNDFNRLEVLANTSLVSTIPAKKITDAIKRTGEITVESWIRPVEPSLSSSSRVISLGIDDSETGFILDQYYNSKNSVKSINYGVRLQTGSTVESGYPEMIPEKSIQYLNMQHVVYVRDTLGKEVVYINDAKVSEGFRPNNFNTWSNDFYLRLGNEKDSNHPWKGTFYSLAIFNKALTASQVHKNFSLGPCDSIRNKGQDLSMTIYPNPSSDYVTVEVIPDEVKEYVPVTYLRIIDMYGRLYHQETMFNPNNQFTTTFDFSNMAKGFYYMQIISGSYQKTTKIIIQ